MDELKNARNKITEIDEKMALLFEERMKQSRIIAEYKKSNGLSVKDTKREKELIERNRKFISDSDIEGYYVRFLQNTIDISCDYQTRLLEGMNVAFSGKTGAYGNIAAQMMFPGAAVTPFPSFAQTYNSTLSGDTDCAVLPLENSVAGEVGQVMDLIFSGDLFINQIINFPVSHCLAGIENADRNTVKTVVSHPQALEQCADYIEEMGYGTKSFPDTASAAEYVKNKNDISVASISSESAAEIFGLNIIDKSINDFPDNITRFASFSREKKLPSPDSRDRDENFIIVFTAKNEAGSLARTLNIIGAHGFNMRTLRSRPMKELRWNYYFYIEAEGNINTQNGRDMLNELSAVCERLKLAGCYGNK